MDIWWRGSAAPPNVLINMATAITMLRSPEAVSKVVALFQVLFKQQRSWQKGQTLLVGRYCIGASER
ncbi:MAG: hypothetical protein HC840_25785 [Leptolyngbyaceae cyanobacterium RM2_2_4]|nr:hypothetical protein [Leptolyngbyaceae cyanobacterium RM2_2_4]